MLGACYSSKMVVIVGAGAFASENARTTLEQGADRVAVVQRWRGAICPLIVDYLNFARPYDASYAHAKSGSQLIFATWMSVFEKCKVT